MQERRNSIANALELRCSCTIPSIWWNERKLFPSKVRIYSLEVHHIYFPSLGVSTTVQHGNQSLKKICDMFTTMILKQTRTHKALKQLPDLKLYEWFCLLQHKATTCMQWNTNITRLCFYQTRSAWSRDQGSNKNHSPAYNFASTVTKFCVMWEGLSLPHDTKFGNCRCKIVDSRVFPIWSLIHGSSWSGLIRAEPGDYSINWSLNTDKIFKCISLNHKDHMGQMMEVRLSCYLVLLSTDSKTR